MSKILVIDDDTTTRLFLRKDLQNEGYEVFTAVDGEEGISKAFELQPAVIICDWMMPKKDGIEVCRSVKSNPQLGTSCFILLTARESIQHRVQGLDAGADEFIIKPVDTAELHARVRAGLRQYQLKRLMRISNEQLQQTIAELKQTQTRLIQNAKLTGLGQMVAGVAHEMNNPVTFIEGNLYYTQDHLQDLFDLLFLYQKCYPEPLVEIKEKIESIDLPFLMKDLPNLITSMQQGTNRLRQIVLSLRNFARLDEAELKWVNIHEGLDNSLLLIQHRLTLAEAGLEIKIEKNYGDLPVVECYPSLLNQVFFNVLTNAIDFIEMGLKYKPISASPPQIVITTHLTSRNTVEIVIEDNGLGMTEEVCYRACDPFFTTKPVGKGMGMGLATSYHTIVEYHHGQLICRSQLYEGTSIMLEIPIQQPIPNSL